MSIVTKLADDFHNGVVNTRIANAAPALMRAALIVKSSGANSARLRKSKFEDVVIAGAAWDELLAAIAAASD